VTRLSTFSLNTPPAFFLARVCRRGSGVAKGAFRNPAQEDLGADQHVSWAVTRLNAQQPLADDNLLQQLSTIGLIVVDICELSLILEQK